MNLESGFWSALPKPIIGLSPMDGVTDASFRQITAIHGCPDIMMTEFLNVDGICHGAESALRGLAYSEGERPVIAQLYGARPEPFFHVAQLVCALGFDGLDINMGCPTKKVAAHGSGAALIKDPDRAIAIIRAARAGIKRWSEGAPLSILEHFPKVAEWFPLQRHLKDDLNEGKGSPRHAIPVSVKTRLGIDRIVIDDWIQQLLEASPAAISIHGRTLRQGYRGRANWEEIARAGLLASGSDTLILGNGDLTSLEDARRRIAETGVDGVLIGRAAMGNPWIFNGKEKLRASFSKRCLGLKVACERIAQRPVSLHERFSVAIEHARLFEADNSGTRFVGMRKHLGSYCRGFSGARGLRMKLVHVHNTDDVAGLFADYHAEEAMAPVSLNRSHVLLASTCLTRKQMTHSQPRMILASTSPRRKEILSRLGLPFETIAPTFQEHSIDAITPAEEALLFAEEKARSVSDRYPMALVIGSDTLIEFQGEKIGKPSDPRAAISILRRLQGQSHLIWTAVFLIDTRDGTSDAAIEKTAITMQTMSDAEVKAYVATGEPLDKAGAYAIQGEGRRFIRGIEGDLLAAIGLPLRALETFLLSRNIKIPTTRV